jgi:class 3 adenylate cyclase/tetratricopeptide (TPR) repeat protein
MCWRGGVEAERRQVTVLFADVVGFTAFSEKSGEEAAFTLMRSLSGLMDEAVREQGGVVRGFTGDGIMAVFGAPAAFEDAPLRACRAALSILQKVKTVGPEFAAKHGVQPKLRIGLNTGAAVVGAVQQGVDAGVTVLGDTVNVAARLQALAEPNSATMSEVTQRFVQGMVEASFAGVHTIKGKSEPQKVWRLNGIREGATRFGAAVSRGLSAFVGRERELEVLERGFDDARSQLRVVDLAAEPGMGKSRLLYEFRHRIGKERAFFLTGSCSPDGQQTPFLPFIEVVRGSFRLGASEAEKGFVQKLEMGLTTLGLQSLRNLGLLLHLLGLKVPEGSLTGLDGVLIGLRTRELLQQLLEARCRLSPVAMMIEDLHWVDSASQELLGRIVEGEASLRLLLITTRRPEYVPPWFDRAAVTKLRLDPLPVGHIRRLIQSRLAVDVLPDALARQITDKAEGNPLFADEIVSFLTDRGILRTTVDFDPNALAAALPMSVQSLLTVRVDRLAADDRALLQAASVIGRRFESQLLAEIVGRADMDARLQAMQAIDLVHSDGKAGDYSFKHALVRDALYQSLLSEPRTALHLKIAEEIERRSGNRLTEVAEVLAHHFSQTARDDKAFAFLMMAGAKALGVYSLDEASAHFDAALALLDNNPSCASDGQVADFLVSYATLLEMSEKIRVLIDLLERYSTRIDHLGDDPRSVVIRYYHSTALWWNTRYRDAAAAQREISQMAERLGDSRSKAYALIAEFFVSMTIAPKPLSEFEILKKEAIRVASNIQDAYVENWSRAAIGWDYLHRGRINDARDAMRELMERGRVLGDPRSTGLALSLLTWIAFFQDSYSEALEYSEQALTVAITPQDRTNAVLAKGCALALLGQTEAGAPILDEVRRRCVSDGDLYRLNGNDASTAVCKILQGDIGDGIRFLEDAISRQENKGYLFLADYYRLLLCEVYLQIISGNEKLPLASLLKNLPILLKVSFTALARIHALTKRVLENRGLDASGQHVGSAHKALGLLYKVKKRRALALEHLTEAKRIFSQFGPSPVLTRVETALTELRQ